MLDYKRILKIDVYNKSIADFILNITSHNIKVKNLVSVTGTH